jgi:hypothetical protein
MPAEGALLADCLFFSEAERNAWRKSEDSFLPRRSLCLFSDAGHL